MKKRRKFKIITAEDIAGFLFELILEIIFEALF